MYLNSKEHLKNLENASKLGREVLKKQKEERIKKYYEDPKKCKECSSILEYDKRINKFCSSKCSINHNHPTKGKKHSEEIKNKISKSLTGKISPKKGTGKNTRMKSIKKCLNCNIQYEAKKEHQKYCSALCSRTRGKTAEEKEKMSLTAKKRVQDGIHVGWNSRKIRSYAEKFFEKVLTNNNIKFLQEYKIKKIDLGFKDVSCYFLDFYFPNIKLNLEIDGKQHNYPDRKIKDKIRDKALIKYGINVYRIKWKNPIGDKNEKYIKNEINKFLTYYNSKIEK